MDGKRRQRHPLPRLPTLQAVGGAILGFIIAYCIAGFVAGLIVLVAFVVTGAALVMFKQRRGLHSKKVDRGVFVYASSRRL